MSWGRGRAAKTTTFYVGGKVPKVRGIHHLQFCLFRPHCSWLVPWWPQVSLLRQLLSPPGRSQEGCAQNSQCPVQARSPRQVVPDIDDLNQQLEASTCGCCRVILIIGGLSENLCLRFIRTKKIEHKLSKVGACKLRARTVQGTVQALDCRTMAQCKPCRQQRSSELHGEFGTSFAQAAHKRV